MCLYAQHHTIMSIQRTADWDGTTRSTSQASPRMSDGMSRCPTSTCFTLCGAKSSSMTSEGHGEHSPATRANVTGVAGTVDGILLDSSSICVVHTLATTSLPASTVPHRMTRDASLEHARSWVPSLPDPVAPQTEPG